jgi:hypothetical protein
VVLGTGSTGKLAARLLHKAGVARLSVAGRNAARAAEVAAALRAGHLPASDVPAVLAGDALGRRLAHLLLEYGGAALLDRTSHGVTAPRSRALGGVSRCVV